MASSRRSISTGWPVPGSSPAREAGPARRGRAPGGGVSRAPGPRAGSTGRSSMRPRLGAPGEVGAQGGGGPGDGGLGVAPGGEEGEIAPEHDPVHVGRPIRSAAFGPLGEATGVGGSRHGPRPGTGRPPTGGRHRSPRAPIQRIGQVAFGPRIPAPSTLARPGSRRHPDWPHPREEAVSSRGNCRGTSERESCPIEPTVPNPWTDAPFWPGARWWEPASPRWPPPEG